MAKFKVTLYVHTEVEEYTAEIEAEDEDEAVEIAIDQAESEGYSFEDVAEVSTEEEI